VRPFHKLIAIFVCFLWGFHFVVMKIGMREVPFLTYGWFRFVLSSIPIFFIKRPTVGLKPLFLIGLFNGVIHPILILMAIDVGLSAGLAALLLQIQAFFTVLLSMIVFKTKPKKQEMWGMAISFLGIIILAIERGGHMSMWGLIFMIISSFFMAWTNILYRQSGQFDPLALAVWMSAVPAIMLMPVNGVIHGASETWHLISNLSPLTWGCFFFTAALSTGLGTTLWARLFQLYPPEKVIPFSLMIPVFGILSSWIVFDEAITWGMSGAMAIVFVGLIINQFPQRPSPKASL
jgi:O-acetylserine/cysteine efflux transporter